MNPKTSVGSPTHIIHLLTKWITAPIYPVKDPEIRRQIQFLAGLVFLFGMFMVLAIILTPLSGFGGHPSFCMFLAGGLALLTPVYLISRTPLYRLAIRFMLALTSAFPFVALIMRQDFTAERIQSVLLWLIAGFLMSVSLLSLPSAIILITADILAVLALPILFPVIPYSALIPVLGFLATAATLILANIYYRDRIEQGRRRELLHEKELSDNIINGLPGIFSMHDAQGNLVRSNRRLEQVTGYPFEELARKKVEDFIQPADGSPIQSVFQRVLAQGTADTETFLMPKDGGQVRYYLTSLRETFADQPFVLAFGVDMTALEQAKQAQEESQKNLLALLNAYPDTAFLTDTQGNLIALNETTAQEFNRTEEELIGTSAYALLSPALAESRKEKLKQAIATRRPVRFVDQGKQGGWNDNTIFPIVGADGHVRRIAVYGRNITEYKIAEQKLSESETKFRNIVESSPMGMHMYKLEEDGRLIFTGANPAADTLLGINHSQFIGKTLEEAFPNLAGTEVPKRHRQTCAKNQPWHTEQIVYEDDRIRSAFEVHAFQTAPGMMTALFIDVTKRKQAEEKIRQRLNELATVNMISQVAASQLELNSLIELIGEKLRQIPNVHGLYIALYDSAAGLISFPYWRIYDEIVQADSHPIGLGLVSRVISSRQPLIINEDYERRSAELGVIRRILAKKTFHLPKTWLGIPMYVGDQAIGILSVQNFEQEHAFTQDDIRLWSTIAANVAVAIQNAQLYAAAQQELSGRRKLIDELESRNAELERFTYTVSHDLKAPLITIQGFLGFVEQDAKAANIERLKSDIERISQATKKMQQLLNELLELSRIGRMMNPPEDVSFAEIVRDALTLVQGRLDANHIRVHVADDLPMVRGDRARLIEVVQNLVDNAAKFTSDQADPLIEIGLQGAEPNGNRILFVRDNGVGIDPEYRERIFGLFNKLDPQTEGTGIGLALVKRIVEVHGGKIWVESAGHGKGSTFFFTLPPVQ